MINQSSRMLKENLLEIEYRESKEHLCARMLLERSEAIQVSNMTGLQEKVIFNYGEAALDILREVLKEIDLQYFDVQNQIINFFELNNYVKIGYSDRKIRQRMLADLIYERSCFIANSGISPNPGLEMLSYAADAIAFLAKNKIQYIEDFSVIFKTAEATADKTDDEFDIGVRIQKNTCLSEFFAVQSGDKNLLIRHFSASLQESAYCDLTSGSFKAPIPGLKTRSFLGGSTVDYGEKAYWDNFFWFRPGLWLRQNLANVSVLI